MSTECKAGALFKPPNRPGIRLGLSLIIALSVMTSSPLVMLLNPTLVEASSPKSTDPTSFSVPSTIVRNGGDSDFTTQAALSNVNARPSNNIVGVNSYYEVIFTTTTAGVIKFIDVTFPAGTIIGSAPLLLVEKEGIGAGTASKVSNTQLRYTVTSAVNVPAGTKIRLELFNIVNPSLPASTAVTVTTRNAGGTAIDGPTASTVNTIKQIGTGQIADGAVTNSKLALFAVNTPNIAPQSITGGKLEFGTVTSDRVAPGTFGLPVVQRIGPFVNIPFGAPFITQTDASCLSGEQVIGGGNAISFSDDDILSFIYLGGFVEGNSWRAAATNGDPSSTISFASVAICALDFP